MKHRLWTLFSSMLMISAFTFGGGFVIVSLMKKRLVDELQWLTEEEMLDMTALAQSAPGPIAVNAAILAGRRIGGLPGMLAAVGGTLLPPLVIIGLVS
ncbi:MAG: chromate transporter, partial [Clostridia bacterium]|nr:chromate transporter [Clostridia bacterium]